MFVKEKKEKMCISGTFVEYRDSLEEKANKAVAKQIKMLS